MHAGIHLLSRRLAPCPADKPNTGPPSVKPLALPRVPGSGVFQAGASGRAAPGGLWWMCVGAGVEGVEEGGGGRNCQINRQILPNNLPIILASHMWVAEEFFLFWFLLDELVLADVLAVGWGGLSPVALCLSQVYCGGATARQASVMVWIFVSCVELDWQSHRRSSSVRQE